MPGSLFGPRAFLFISFYAGFGIYNLLFLRSDSIEIYQFRY